MFYFIVVFWLATYDDDPRLLAHHGRGTQEQVRPLEWIEATCVEQDGAVLFPAQLFVRLLAALWPEKLQIDTAGNDLHLSRCGTAVTNDLRPLLGGCCNDAISLFDEAALHFEPQGRFLCGGIRQLLQVRQRVKHGDVRHVPALRKFHTDYSR